ncbi:hypothetical protein [Campylobacter hyointestinalis]|nr:hypothetical protein [Campylobacter hyointestinalis]
MTTTLLSSLIIPPNPKARIIAEMTIARLIAIKLFFSMVYPLNIFLEF